MFFIFLLAILTLFYYYLTWNFTYWKKLGVNGPKPRFLVGNFPSFIGQKRHFIYDLDDIYSKYKKTENFVGIYSGGNPLLLITCPALTRRIFVNDFKHFQTNEVSQIFDKNCNMLFTLSGQEWKNRQAELIPGLTLGRIKNAYPVTKRVCKRMTNYIKEQIKLPPKNGLDCKDICLRFTSEVVTDCVLGLNADSFGKRPTPILNMIASVLDTSSRKILIYTGITWFFPMLKSFYKVQLVPKETQEFFLYLTENGIDFCKAQRRRNPNLFRTDFLDYMLQLQEKKNLSCSHLTSHTLSFLVKGIGIIALVTEHCLLMIGRHASVQDKLRSEFEKHVDRNGVVDFDALVALPYLDACIHETIRLFPPDYYSNKICTEPIELVNKNGHILHLQKGEIIALPVYSLMMDEDYYPNPQEFKPERFLEENGGVKKFVENGVFLGFGDGPRMCLGKNFALAQSKAAIVEILWNFNVRVNPRTRKDNQWDPKTLQMHLEGGIWLGFEARNLECSG